MKILQLIVVCLLLQTDMNVFAQPNPKLERHLTVRPGEFLVKFRTGVAVAEASPQAMAATNGLAALAGSPAELLGVYSDGNVLHFKVKEPADAAAENVANATAESIASSTKANAMMQGLAAANPQIEYVQPNYVYYPTATPNDMLLSQLRFVKNIGLDKAWDIRHDAEDTIVAVIDTGVMTAHPDLKDNIWVNADEVPNNGQDDDNNGFKDDVNGWDFFNDDNDPTADLVQQGFPFFGFCLNFGGQHFEAHGTHVAGTIGARGNNGRGISGVAWKTKIMPLKFLGGPCGNGDTANSIKAIDYAVKNGAKIINCSWGSRGESGTDGDLLLKDAIRRAGDQDVLVVCAAGNEASDNDAFPHYPSNFDLQNNMAVGATDDQDTQAVFSNVGRKTVHIFAPGVNIHSTAPDGSAVPATEGYRDLSGTSMAAPVVSGVAALVRGQFPTLSASQVRAWLMASSDKVSGVAGLCISEGRINAHAALLPPTIQPSPQIATLTSEQRTALEAQVSADDRVRMVILGGMPLNQNKASKVAKEIPFEFLIQFKSKMTADSVKTACATSLADVAKVETVSEEGNIFKVLGTGHVAPGELADAMKKLPNVGIVQPNFKYSKEK